MKIDRTASSVIFVYPFCFRGPAFDGIARSISAAKWPGRDSLLQVWEKAKFPKEDLLAHVAEYLNPEGDNPATARLWKLTGAVLQSSHGLGNNSNWQLLARNPIPFHIDEITLMLFLVGVGFIAISVKPLSDAPEDWLDFTHFFRFTDTDHGTKLRVSKSRAAGEVVPYFPEPAGGLVNHPNGEGAIEDILEGLLATGAPDCPRSPWWDDIFVPDRMLPFSSLFFEGAPTEQRPEFLYRARRFFHAKQEIRLTLADREYRHESLQEYVDNQWFAFSLDGSAFVAFDAPNTPFFRQNLPQHLRSQYFLLFVIVLHQRFALMKFSADVAKSWPIERSDALKETKFTQLRHDMLVFTARGYFSQVMQRENHHRCYRRWQDIFQVTDLYAEVRDEVLEMHNTLIFEKTAAAEARTKALEHSISMLGVFIGVPALVIGFLGINLQGITAQEGLLWWQAGLIGIGGGLFSAALVLLVIRKCRSGKP
jgi:hypothetical protein